METSRRRLVVVSIAFGLRRINVSSYVFTLLGIGGSRFLAGSGHMEELENKKDVGLTIKGNGFRN